MTEQGASHVIEICQICGSIYSNRTFAFAFLCVFWLILHLSCLGQPLTTCPALLQQAFLRETLKMNWSQCPQLHYNSFSILKEIMSILKS